MNLEGEMLLDVAEEFQGRPETLTGFKFYTLRAASEMLFATAGYLTGCIIMLHQQAYNQYYIISLLLCGIQSATPITLYIFEDVVDFWMIQPLTLFYVSAFIFNLWLFKFEFPFINTNHITPSSPWTQIVPIEWWAACSRIIASVFALHYIIFFQRRARQRCDVFNDVKEIEALALGVSVGEIDLLAISQRRKAMHGLMLRREEMDVRRFDDSDTSRIYAQRARRVVSVLPPSEWWWKISENDI